MLTPAREEAYVLFRCQGHDDAFIGVVEFWATRPKDVRKRMPVIGGRRICEPEFQDVQVVLPTDRPYGGAETYREIYSQSEFFGCRGIPNRRLDIQIN